MRLIDADTIDDVVQDLNENHNSGITRNEYKRITAVLYEMPTIDAVPAGHGKWDCSAGLPTCTACGKMPREFYIDGSEKWPFCPNCGARMDGGKDDGT